MLINNNRKEKTKYSVVQTINVQSSTTSTIPRKKETRSLEY